MKELFLVTLLATHTEPVYAHSGEKAQEIVLDVYHDGMLGSPEEVSIRAKEYADDGRLGETIPWGDNENGEETCQQIEERILRSDADPSRVREAGEKPASPEKPMMKEKVEGVGPDAPTVTNKEGGKQSHVPYRADLLPPVALLQVSKILSAGAEKYGAENWRKIGRRDHVNHAMVHLLAMLAGDEGDDHLGHAACRLLFALET